MRLRFRPRRSRPRAKTIAPKDLTRAVLRTGAAELDSEDLDRTVAERPRTRGECGTQRPCPFVSCRHHLYLDINPETGSIKFNFPDLEPEDLKESCSLDVADRYGVTLEETGGILNITRERVRQLEVRALLTLKGICRREA